jgi:hypothetical protein
MKERNESNERNERERERKGGRRRKNQAFHSVIPVEAADEI